MAFYDRIALQWEAATGDAGGALKRNLLNEVLLRRLVEVRGGWVLELGAGNGYFAALLARHRRGRRPARMVISDVSAALLEIARTERPVVDAEYLCLNGAGPYPFEPVTFDVVLATMVFQEIGDEELVRALGECGRVLKPGGQLLMTVLHPRFVHSLDRRGELAPAPGARGRWTMPGPGSLRLPIVIRESSEYERLLAVAGFSWARSPRMTAFAR
ncbi:MAG: class I SAM-dependent methyltransferase [Planctomycetes bacterium]|nr:class I SAM-dependent methyltransferase [Planctomycetota bacterium]